MQPRFALASFSFWVIELFLKEAKTHCIFSFFFLSLEYDKDSKLPSERESQATEVTNSIKYSVRFINSMGVSN